MEGLGEDRVIEADGLLENVDGPEVEGVRFLAFSLHAPVKRRKVRSTHHKRDTHPASVGMCVWRAIRNRDRKQHHPRFQYKPSLQTAPPPPTTRRHFLRLKEFYIT